ncbi:YwbE family protein [Candidatus Parcubacteria bacterium]|nr:MAG: YwbE family protein [Candidatus Parcubacteria bacterium]
MEPGNDNPNPPPRSKIRPGDAVWIIEKEHYGTNNYTQGFVQDILTPREFHPRGIKVRLKTGEVGRVQWLMRELPG